MAHQTGGDNDGAGATLRQEALIARVGKKADFAGTGLIVEHIEKYVCPTVTSDQLLGGSPFKFKGDRGE